MIGRWLIVCNRMPQGHPGDPALVTTLGHVIDMKGNSPNRTIAEVMDIGGDVLCYEYVDPEF